MSNWLKNILSDVEQRAAGRPEWQRSEYAQVEIARLKATPNLPSVSSSTHGKGNKGDK
jgi:hypothetical protein